MLQQVSQINTFLVAIAEGGERNAVYLMQAFTVLCSFASLREMLLYFSATVAPLRPLREKNTPLETSKASGPLSRAAFHNQTNHTLT